MAGRVCVWRLEGGIGGDEEAGVSKMSLGLFMMMYCPGSYCASGMEGLCVPGASLSNHPHALA